MFGSTYEKHNRAIAKMVLEHVCKLSSDVEKMTFESQKEKEEMNNLMMMPHNVQLYLQQCEKQFEKIENNMSHLTGNPDVLQHDQCFNSVKIDELTKNQHVLQQQHNSAVLCCDRSTIKQPRCSTTRTEFYN